MAHEEILKITGSYQLPRAGSPKFAALFRLRRLLVKLHLSGSANRSRDDKIRERYLDLAAGGVSVRRSRLCRQAAPEMENAKETEERVESLEESTKRAAVLPVLHRELDFELIAKRNLAAGNLALGQFEDRIRLPADTGHAKGTQAGPNLHYAHFPVEGNDVDGKAHSEGMHTGRRPDQHPSSGIQTRLPE